MSMKSILQISPLPFISQASMMASISPGEAVCLFMERKMW
jgi:hypothetical protein